MQLNPVEAKKVHQLLAMKQLSETGAPVVNFINILHAPPSYVSLFLAAFL